jgi:FAD/FMN-containing dehydrogenase
VQPVETELSGWAGYPRARVRLVEPDQTSSVESLIDRLAGASLIARGAGMAYGDAAINTDQYVLGTRRLTGVLAFDTERGQVTCRAGTPLAEIHRLTLPAGWMLPVIPGTARATVAGCVACDAHGKNHARAGSFGAHVDELTLLTASGAIERCGPERAPELFWASVGGMGLTGVILEVTLRLSPVETAWIESRSICSGDLEQTFDVLEEHAHSDHSLVWLDGASRGRRLGRGIVMSGAHLPLSDLPAELRSRPLDLPERWSLRVPCALPRSLLVRPLTAAFNRVLFSAYRRRDGEPVHAPLAAALHPLDALANWNRLLGRRGFLEYQVALPASAALATVRSMLEQLVAAGEASFLTSLKRLGPETPAPLSFPMPGYAFSFDLPIGRGGPPALLERFDRQVCEVGGRVYLAKDSRLPAHRVDVMYPRRSEWAASVNAVDPKRRFESALSRRLALRGPHPEARAAEARAAEARAAEARAGRGGA